MRHFRSAIAATFTALALAPSAFAVDPNYVTTVTATPATVTRGTFAGYDVKITNFKPNAISGVRLIGTTSVVGATAPFFSSSGAACVTTTTDTSISCPIGELPGGGASVSFSITFSAPSTGTQIDFAWISVFDESGSGGSDGDAGTTPALLSAPDTLQVTSHVPAAGVTLFTGSTNGVPNGGDQAATKVTVPQSPVATTATINESTFSVGCTNFKTCYESSIGVPSFEGSLTSYLTIILRQDKSNIKNGTRIESVLIDYVDDMNTVATGDDVLHSNIGDCASETTPRTDGVPCIAKRVSYKNKRVSGWTPDLDGDFEWRLLNTKNGLYRTK